MELILWRHAEAHPGEPDEARELTPKGRKQALKMAAWLDCHLTDRCKILVSPTLRTVQTAQALGRKFKVTPELHPDAAPEQLLALARWPTSREPVLIIGHRQTLGQAAALLLCGSKQNWTIRKACAWWIVQKEEDGVASPFLKAVMSPALVTK